MNLAREKNLPLNEVIDLLLYASALGLFGTDWLLLCPQCSCIVESFRSLTGVRNQYHCKLCQIDYEASLDDYIAVTFTVSPEIREIAFHHPERLSAWDYFFKVSGTRDGVMPDGTAFVDVQASLTKAIAYLPPSETTRLTTEASEGLIFGATLEGKAPLFHRDGVIQYASSELRPPFRHQRF